MKHIHFFHHQELPVPGSAAKPVSYPVCEWRAPKGDATDADQHPLNRFVCSWLTSDMAEVARCDEALQALARLRKLHEGPKPRERFSGGQTPKSSTISAMRRQVWSQSRVAIGSGKHPEVKIHLTSLSDGVMDIRWS